MADNYITNPGAGGVTFASDEDGGAIHYPIMKLAWGPLDTFNLVADAAGKGVPVKIIEVGAVTLPVSGPLTDGQLRAVAVPVSGTFFQATQPVSIAGVVTVSVNNFPASQAVTGPLTDVQLRATPVPVSGTVTANAGANLNTSALLLDATFTGRINTQGQKAMAASTPVVIASDQSAVPVSGTVAVSGGTVSTKTDLAPAVPTNATVGAASAQAVAANGARKGLHLRNTSLSGQRISLSMNGAATLDDGITLYPQDIFEMGEYDFDQGAINAIASAGSARLSVQEFA